MAELAFDCIGAQAERYAVLPTISLALRISETSGQRVHASVLGGAVHADSVFDARFGCRLVN